MAWWRCTATTSCRSRRWACKAGRETHGHRFEAAVDPIALRDADSYAAQLRDEGAVIAGFDARRAEIVRQLAAAAAQVGGGAQPIDDDALLDEVTALVERPNVLVCEFEREFLDVPQECLILTMKANQKYFPLLDAAGKLTNRFLVVSNIRPADPSARDRGQRARGAPAPGRRQVLLRPGPQEVAGLARAESLAKVVYHNKLGTQGERVERVCAIARAIAEQLGDAALARAGRRGRAAGQGRPGDRHGRRVPRAAGHHGPLLRAATTASAPRSPTRSRTTTSRASPATRCRATTSAWWWRWPTSWRRWSACSASASCRPATRIRSRCAAMRWA